MAESYEVIADSRDPESWKRARVRGIGASEAAVLLGQSPWKSMLQLYAEKTGLVSPPDLSDVEAVEWGNRLEPVILEAYRDRSGRYVDRGGLLLQSTRYPWAICTLDGWTGIEQIGPYWPLELKTTGAQSGSAWVDGPPDHYLAQIAWQMLVTDAPRATIACLIGGQRLVWCDVERDEMLMRRLIHRGEEFWGRVERREPPPAGGSDADRAALHALYPRDDGELLVLPAELLDAADEIDECREAEKAIRLRKTAAENRLKEALGTKERGALPDGRLVSWKTTERAGYSVAPSTTRTLRITQPKKAS